MTLTLIQEDIDKALKAIGGICHTCCIAQCLKRNNIPFTHVSISYVWIDKNIVFTLDINGRDITFLNSSQWKDIKLPYEFSINEPKV